MKGVLRARACCPARGSREGGRSDAAPLLFTVICLHPLIQNAENATSPSLASIIEIVHSPLESNESARKTLDNG